MPSYITETTDEKPQVLLISAPGVFPTLVTEELNHGNIDVYWLDESIFAEDTNSSLNNLAQISFYRICWVWGELSEAPQSASKIIEFLLTRSEKQSVISAGLAPFETADVRLNNWTRIFELQQRNLKYLQQFLANAQLLLTSSWVGERQDYLTRLIYDQLIQPQPAIPKISLGAFTRAEVIPNLVSLLLKPTKGKKTIFLQSRVFGIDQVLEAFSLRNNQEVSKIDVTKTEPAFTDFSEIVLEKNAGKNELLKEIKNWQIQVPKIEPVKKIETDSEPVSAPETREKKQIQVTSPIVADVIEEEKQIFPRANPKKMRLGRLKNPEKTVPIQPPVPPIWYPELDAQLELLLKKSKPKVVAPFSPLINNRLKKYELLKKQKEDQQKLRQHLPRKKKIDDPKKKIDFNQLDEADLDAIKEIDSQLSKLFQAQRQVSKNLSQAVTIGKVARVAAKNQRRSKFILLLGVAIGVSVFTCLLCGIFFLNRLLLENSMNQVMNADDSFSTRAENYGEMNQLRAISSIFSFQVSAWQIVLGKENLKSDSNLAELGKNLAESATMGEGINQTAQGFWQQVFESSKISSLPTLTNLEKMVSDLYNKLSVVQGQVETSSSLADANTSKKYDDFNAKIQDRRKSLAVSQQFGQLLPFLLGQASRKTYLVVLQNNLELRPTGGVVQAASLVTFQNGFLTNTQSLNVAQIDQNFSGQIVPPTDLQNILGQKNWLFRDANWSAEFPSAAQQMENFVEKSTNQQIDGVIAFNLLSLQDLIHAGGPIPISQYQEVVTDKNLMEKVAFHSELAVSADAIPDYLSLLLNQELIQLANLPAEKTTPVLNSLYTSLKNDQLFISVKDKSVNAALDSVGWTGGVLTPNCPAQFSDPKVTCLVDPIFQVDTNVGINRANFFIHHKITQQIQVSPNLISHTRNVTYFNSATSNAWPAGNYKNYVRFYLPDSAENITVKINSQTMNQSDLIQSSEGRKKVVGLLLSVPIQQQVVMTLKYDEPVESATPFAYTFFDQKQSGTAADDNQIEITPDQSLKPVYIAPQATVQSSGMVSFSEVQDKHLFVGIKFR